MIQEEKLSGFAAGTLVHTDKGLVPIEHIQVGDMVLSKPDTASNAPNSYKRVVSAYKSSEKKPIQLLGIVNAVRENMDEWYPENSEYERFLLTQDHPVWVEKSSWASENLSTRLERPVLPDEKLGWQPANFISTYMELKLVDLSKATCTFDGTDSLYTTDMSGLFYTVRFSMNEPDDIWEVKGNQINRYSAFDILIFGEEGGDYETYIAEGDFPQSIIDFGRFWFSSRRALHLYGEEVVKTFADKPNFKLREFQVQMEEKTTQSKLYASDYVHNIEVEAYNTYFIGKLGLLVHDASANIS